MKMKKAMALLLTVVLLAALSGCGAKSEAAMDNGAERYENVLYGGLYDGASGSIAEGKPAESSVTANQKLVRTMTVTAETADMDALLTELDQKISSLGGYLENKSIRNGNTTSTNRYRYGDMTIRIPADRLGEFIDHISGQTNVLSYNESADDITLRYVATQSRVIALETEQQRLLELLAKAEDMTDLLLIEERLTNVRTELEEVTSQMRIYDNMVDYGTVHLSVTEVQEYTPVQEKTVWQKIGSGLKENWKGLCTGIENLFVFLIVSLPYTIPMGGIAALIIVAVKRRKKKKLSAKNQEKAE